MNTFLPYADFAKSAECLDRARLGKQRVEVLQLLKALLVPNSGWANHPCAKMWRGHEQVLIHYGTAICIEWRGRGYRDTCAEKLLAYMPLAGNTYTLPHWLGYEPFHRSHRSNLTRKDPIHYGTFWQEPSDLPYIWPGEVNVASKVE